MYIPIQGRFSQAGKILLVLVLCLGIFFRFANLDKKVLWVDEVATAIRVSGYTLQEMTADLTDRPAQTLPQLQKYQYPNSEKTLGDTATSLAAEDVHPPLFFFLLRLWIISFGNSVTALRSLAAVFSVLMFPAIWWLCRELFSHPATSELTHRNRPLSQSNSIKSNLIGWVAVALLAVSPTQVVYAQESRQYTLWMLLILLSGASLLRSLRINRWHSWVTYGILLALGLYTHYLFTLVVAGHGLYVFCVEQLKIKQLTLKQFSRKQLKPARKFLTYLLTSSLAWAAYLPWVIYSRQFPTDASQLDWMEQPPGIIEMAVRLTGVLSRSFIDLGVESIGSSAAMLVVVPLLLLTMGTCLLAIIRLIRKAPFRTWFFVATLGGITGAVVIGSYFVLGKAVATTRFVLPISLSLQIAVAYLLVTGFKAPPLLRGGFGSSRLQPQPVWQPAIGRVLGGLLLSIGIVSCALRLNAPIWWTQMPYLNQDIPAIAQSISQQDNALVIMDGSKNVPFFDMVQPQSLLHSVDSNTQMQMQIVEKVVPDLGQATDKNIFIYLPVNASGMTHSPAALQAEMSKRYGVSLRPVVPGTFWQVQR